MKNQNSKSACIVLVLGALGTAAIPLHAQITASQVVAADTFVSSGQPTMNFGALGAMEIASPTSGQNRTEESLMQFNAAAIKSTFDSDYGAGNWTVTAVTLKLFSNFPTAGQQPGNSSFNKIAAGGFQFDWLSDDNWSESAVTWNNLPNLLPGTATNELDSLGTFNWAADGSASQTWTLTLDTNLVNDIQAGDAVTVLGQPTSGSTVGYLFNTLNNNPGYLNVTAQSTQAPEPAGAALAGCGLLAWLAFRQRAAKK
jgi:hypothetical protein